MKRARTLTDERTVLCIHLLVGKEDIRQDEPDDYAARPSNPACHSRRSRPSADQALLTVLGGLAEFERELIRARTDEGRKRAQARGVRFGRKPKLSAFQIAEAMQRREAGEPLTDIGRSYGVSHSTISRL